MMSEKDLLKQIRKKHVAPLIGTSIVAGVIIIAMIFAMIRRPHQNMIEAIFLIVLMALIFGSAAFVYLYQFLNPQKDIFFRKYGKPSEVIALVNAALSESKIYSNNKLTITEHFIYNPNDFSTLLKIEDVLLAQEEYVRDNKKEYACVGLVDIWGVRQLFKYKISEVDTVRQTIAAIRENFPEIKIGANESNLLSIQGKIKKLK